MRVLDPQLMNVLSGEVERNGYALNGFVHICFDAGVVCTGPSEQLPAGSHQAIDGTLIIVCVTEAAFRPLWQGSETHPLCGCD